MRPTTLLLLLAPPRCDDSDPPPPLLLLLGGACLAIRALERMNPYFSAARREGAVDPHLANGASIFIATISGQRGPTGRAEEKGSYSTNQESSTSRAQTEHKHGAGRACLLYTSDAADE